MKSRKFLVGLGVVGVALLTCCIIGTLFGPGKTPSPKATATIMPSPTHTPISATPAPIIWILKAPAGATHILFCEEILTTEDIEWDCALGDLSGGTKLTPAEEGCQQTTWDISYTYCHVRVLDGDLAGNEGWVNQEFIKR